MAISGVVRTSLSLFFFIETLRFERFDTAPITLWPGVLCAGALT
jgi:hypothetical protein